MDNVIRFRLYSQPKRHHVLAWLKQNIKDWPRDMTEHVGEERFHGWRFIKCLDGEIVFADCLHKGITEEEFRNAAKCA